MHHGRTVVGGVNHDAQLARWSKYMEDFFLEFSLAKAVKAIVVGAEGSARGSGVGGEGEILGIGSQCASGIGYGMILVIVCLGIVVIDGTNTVVFRKNK